MEQANQASAAMIRQLLLGMGMLSKGFYERYGKESLPVITEVMSRGGEESGKAMRQMGTPKSMKDVGEAFMMMGKMMGAEMDILELSDEAMHFKMSSCPLGVEGTDRELCEALMTHDAKMMSTFLGKDLDMKILQTVAAGDSECEGIVSIK